MGTHYIQRQFMTLWDADLKQENESEDVIPLKLPLGEKYIFNLVIQTVSLGWRG